MFAGAFLLVVSAVTLLFWYTQNRQETSPPAVEVGEERELTPEELLERTTAPADAEPITAEKLEEIIKNTTAPSEEGLAPKEEEKLIENTTAPE